MITKIKDSEIGVLNNADRVFQTINVRLGAQAPRPLAELEKDYRTCTWNILLLEGKRAAGWILWALVAGRWISWLPGHLPGFDADLSLLICTGMAIGIALGVRVGLPTFLKLSGDERHVLRAEKVRRRELAYSIAISDGTVARLWWPGTRG